MGMIMRTGKKRGPYRVRNIDVSECYSVGEVINHLKRYPNDTPVILKCSGKNFRICSNCEIDGKPILVGGR